MLSWIIITFIFIINLTSILSVAKEKPDFFEIKINEILVSTSYNEKIEKLKNIFEYINNNNKMLANKILVLNKELDVLEKNIDKKKQIENQISELQDERAIYIESEIALKELYSFFVLKNLKTETTCKNIRHKIYFSYDSIENKENNIYRELSIKLALDICAHQQLLIKKP